MLPPDKGSGVVVMNHKDYVEKMNAILSDSMKFKLDSHQKDSVLSVEKTITSSLQDLFKKGVIDKKTLEDLTPRGSITPRMYGLPKTHKSGIPLRPILSMTGSPYHKLAKWLTKVLEPIRSKMAVHSLKDTFQFVQYIADKNINDQIMASFDVESLFTNVPLHDVISIIHDYAAENRIDVGIPLYDLCNLLSLCTSNIQFLFNGQYYRQIDGVAMGSPLGPVLADIFMAHLEQMAANTITRVSFYKRYVDDIIIFCASKNEAGELCDVFNGLHPRISFTLELESQSSISFLDVLLKRRSDGSIQRCVHRKNTWKGQYINFKSFAPISYKRTLVRTLYDRVRKICSEDNLEKEMEFLHETLKRNGYPTRFIEKYCKQRPKVAVDTVPRMKVYLSLPYKGDNVTTVIKRRLNLAIRRTYPAASLTYIEKTTPLPVPPRKDRVSTLATSLCVYQFCCSCGCKYIGRTVRNLSTRIGEHIPSWLRSEGTGIPKSAITKHLHQTGHRVDSEKAFKVIYRARNKQTLAFAEAVAIHKRSPDLCVQKQMVVNLGLNW